MKAADGADGCALTGADLMGNLAVADAADLTGIRAKGTTFRAICFSLSTTALIGIRAGEDKTDSLALSTLAGLHFVVILESVDAGCFVSVRCLIAGCFNALAVISGFGAGCLSAGCFIAIAVVAAVVPVADVVVVGCQWAIFFGVLFVTGAADAVFFGVLGPESGPLSGTRGVAFQIGAFTLAIALPPSVPWLLFTRTLDDAASTGLRCPGSTGLLGTASAIIGRRIGYVGSGLRTRHCLTWSVNSFLRRWYPAPEGLLLGALADAAVAVSVLADAVVAVSVLVDAAVAVSVLAGASPVFREASMEKAFLVRDPVKATLGPRIPMTMKWDIGGRSMLSMSLASRGSGG